MRALMARTVRLPDVRCAMCLRWTVLGAAVGRAGRAGAGPAEGAAIRIAILLAPGAAWWQALGEPVADNSVSRGWAMFVLLVALAGGAVLAAVAGARRTDSAYPRFLQASNASDVLVSPRGTGLGGYYRALVRLPGVTAVAPLAALNARAPGQVVAPADRRLRPL